MLKNIFLVGLLTLSMNLYTQELKVGEAISGKSAKETLKTLPKELESMLKAPQSKSTRSARVARTGGQYPFDTFTINTATDSLVALNDASGNPLFYVAYTTATPLAVVGDGNSVDSSKLDNPKNYSVQEWNSQTKKFETRSAGRNV